MLATAGIAADDDSDGAGGPADVAAADVDASEANVADAHANADVAAVHDYDAMVMKMVTFFF